MSYKLLIVIYCILCSLQLMGAEQTIDVMVKKTEISQSAPNTLVTDLFAINGIRQAVTKELVEKKLDNEVFWKKVEEKKLNESAEINFFAPIFNSKKVYHSEVSVDADRPISSEKNPPLDLFLRGTFVYELNNEKFTKLYEEVISDNGLPDVGVKTFYILSDIGIDADMTWNDVGVTKKENFSGVIIESWKNWAAVNFKKFSNIVVLDKDFTEKPENMHPESVTLKWNSALKKAEVFQDRKSARFEMTAQYVLVNTKPNESLQAFDFPNQKREFNISNAKGLSSNLASLIYNLLNSQTVKISTALELSQAVSVQSTLEIKIKGKAGLLDISLVNSLLTERFKQISLTSETKSYSSELSVIHIKSSLAADALYALFSKDGGKFPLNEQKILVFNPTDRSFAIIAK